MTDDELKTRLRHSADVLRDMLYDDLAEGCSRTVQRIDDLRAELEAARASLMEANIELQRLHAGELPGGWTGELMGQIEARHKFERELEAAKRDAELLWANCRVIYFPDPSGSYPLEHNMRACGTKDSRADIEAALRIDAARKEWT